VTDRVGTRRDRDERKREEKRKKRDRDETDGSARHVTARPRFSDSGVDEGSSQ